VSEFFSSPDARILLNLVSIVPFIRGFVNPAGIKFLKELHFEREFGYRTVIMLSEILLSIVAALITHSAASFAYGLIFSALVEVMLSFALISPRPKFKYNWTKVKHVLNAGKWVTGFGFFDYIFTQGDNFTVGRILGESSLGIYRTAYSFSTLPVTEISQAYYSVMFPVFVEMRTNLSQLKRAVLRSSVVVSGVMILAGILVFFFADLMVKILLGPNWISAIPVIKVLAIAGLFRGLSYVFNPLFVALGHQKYITIIIFASMATLLISVVPLVQRFGMLGAAYSATLASIITLPVTVFLARKELSAL